MIRITYVNHTRDQLIPLYAAKRNRHIAGVRMINFIIFINLSRILGVRSK